MAAYSAILRGASQVYLVDRVPERLAKAKEIGAVPINFDEGDAVEQILAQRGGKFVDRAVDAVGYQAVNKGGKTEAASAVLNSIIQVVRPTGGLGIPGLYVPSDPGAATDAERLGNLLIPFGKVSFSPVPKLYSRDANESQLFEKGLHLGTGQCNVKKYNRYLRDMIISGRAKPSFVVSHQCSLDGAVEAYEKFDKRVEGYTKVLLKPHGSS